MEVYRVDDLPDRTGGRRVNRGFVYRDGIRFGWGEEAVFDMVDGTCIAYAPGPGWTGAMPVSFYSTVAALTAAWRGRVPLHACAVELDGRAVLVAGPAGAGKSTLTAGLLAAGARLIGDDLTIVAVDGPGKIVVVRGRPTMRLHPDTAARIDTIAARVVDGDPRGKWLVRPRARSTAGQLPLAAILVLGGEEATRPAHPLDLFAHLFRRQWMEALPVRQALMADILTIAATVPVLTYPAQPSFAAKNWQQRARDAIVTVRSLRHGSLMRMHADP